MQFDALILNKNDNVATVIKDMKKGGTVCFGIDGELQKIELKDTIIYGHKLAVRKINKGDEIIKYGEVIGRATNDIHAGMHVHVHNVESLRGRGDIGTGAEKE